MVDFEIRFARPTDVDELVRLCADHAAYERAIYEPVGKHERLAKTLFGSEPPMQCFVVETASRIAGFATFGRQYSTWQAADYLYLDCLYIDSEFRGHGIGHRMMMLIREQASKLGCVQLQWQTPEFNSDAIRFYDRLPKTSCSEKLRYVWTVSPQTNCSN